MKKLYFLLLILCFSTSLLALPGKLLLIGGGSEHDTEDSWNKEAYTWAVTQSENKKVAIIAYGSSSDWIAGYFTEHCGAVEAVNFNISSSSVADNQSMYDDLMQYDVIFLKGGDQYDYYSTYKNTKTGQAIIDKFESGGVICGTSAGLAVLGGIDFTAENGTAYPADAIEDVMGYDKIALADDFLPFVDGILFDTHFAERGRFARLVAFIARWKFDTGETITGIGIDDQTAMALGEDNIGTVYGTGCANIYKPLSDNSFAVSGKKLIGDSIMVTQLLQGCTYNFETGESSGLSTFTELKKEEETGNYTVLMSGSDNIALNDDMLRHFCNQTGAPEDPILIVTGSDQVVAQAFANKLTTVGATQVQVFSGVSDNEDNEDFASAIGEAKKILFVENMQYIFEKFLDKSEGGNGDLLYDKVRQNDMIIAFVGDNSRFAGHTIVKSYEVSSASYYGNLKFVPGLNLLQTTVVIPKTFNDSELYQNTATSVPYTMVLDSLRYGLWLTKNNFVKYYPDNGKTYLQAYGREPVMVLENKGTFTGFAEQTSKGTGSPRMIAGFQNMLFSLIDETTVKQVGSKIIKTSLREYPQKENMLRVFPNPANDSFSIDGQNGQFDIQIWDETGKCVKKYRTHNGKNIYIGDLSAGLFFIRAEIREKEMMYHARLLVR